MNMTNINQKYFYSWTQQQISLLRSRRFNEIDLETLIEEVESMGNSELRELESRLTVLLMHLLKWQYQANLQTRSWILTIKKQRRRIVKRLQQSPSLKSKLNAVIADAYDLARGDAADKTGLAESSFPIQCPWTYTEIVDMEF
ncbi:DUF29 domain-containing protein [Candidatus Marithrix sp. Canyon 246]|uniref:DUF29 domain-containing protein n=1 Tax=Candidatus Marithrix sp. Canyon 246 TaxID=1827136 RepID=UPI000A4E8A9C|nr:DUF29 domain-containing protein [Candidatus Marithrix sp. Canyon 246]